MRKRRRRTRQAASGTRADDEEELGRWLAGRRREEAQTESGGHRRRRRAAGLREREVAEIDGEGAARGRGSELRDTGSNERLLALGRKVARMGLAGLGKVVCRLGLVLGLAGWRLLHPFIFILKLFPFILSCLF
jgi:hypothetical protein